MTGGGGSIFPHCLMSTPGPPLSRRESLKRAAGALALGLGAPAALAGSDDGAPAFWYGKLGFFENTDSREPLAWIEIPHEVMDKLVELDAFSYIKFDGVEFQGRAPVLRVERGR